MADKPYSVGDLEVKISAIGGGALNTLDTVIAKMTSLSSIVKSVTTADLKWISSFNTRVKTLSKNMAEINWDTVDAGFKRLTTAISPFVEKVVSAETSLKSLNQILSRVSAQTEKTRFGRGNQKATKSKIISFGKLMGTYYLMRRLGNVAADIVQYGVDYTEVLNLWQVAMRDNLSMATQFVDKMSKAYGISQKTLMQAQATFRNMIGSLGDLNDMTSYALSEAITQMAIDYASLYNAPIEEAINKFQSALAGQVRPIRSVSGYDITEKTIHSLYQAIGGTKTQRQLSRTEKQLLAIYAIFNQMEKSGALGDMTKTLGNFANQSRMMAENWKELATWVGTIITFTLQENGIMVKINAMLITMANIAKAIAFSLGYETPNFAEGWENNVDGTITAVEELQGKLLGFDKIRALQTEEESISIDEKLLQAISGYSSLISQANNEAANLAKTWTSWFIDEETGKFTQEAKDLGNAIKDIGKFVGILIAYNLVSKITKLTLALFGLKTLSAGLSKILLTGIVFAVIEAIEAFEKGDKAAGILAISIGVLSGAVLAYIGVKKLEDLVNKQSRSSLLLTAIAYNKVRIAASLAAVAGVGLFVASLQNLIGNWDELKGFEKVIGIFGAIGAAALAAAAAVAAFHGSWTLMTAVPAIVGGLLAITAAFATFKGQIEEYAHGGTPDKGTLFIAGEAGAEIVSTSSNGQTGVSNVQQIEQAMYNALVRYGSAYSQGDEKLVVQIGDDAVFNATRKAARRRGLDFGRR